MFCISSLSVRTPTAATAAVEAIVSFQLGTRVCPVKQCQSVATVAALLMYTSTNEQE